MVGEIIRNFFNSKNSFIGHSDYSTKPGLYAFVLNDKSNLKEFGSGGQVVYVGKAEDSLTKRDLKTHFNSKSTGSSTLRRSIGAILKKEIKITAFSRDGSDSQRAINHFIFDLVGESRLTTWMMSNLEIGYWEYDKNMDGETLYSIEEKVIIELRPTLDLDIRTKRFNNYANELDALRQVCKDEARQNAVGMKSRF